MNQDAPLQAHVADARGLSFRCLPGCGFCCTASPLVQPREAEGLGGWVTRASDGTLRIPVKGVSCGALAPDQRCGVYETRPAVCRLYPFAVHAGRRVQATVSLACPGVEGPLAPPSGPAVDEGMAPAAREAALLALSQPGAGEMAARARASFLEFDRRMREWGVVAPPDKLRAAFLPHVERLASPAALPAFFAGLGEGSLLLDGKAAQAVEALFEEEPQAEISDLLLEAAEDAFGGQDAVLWVDPDLSWVQPTFEGGKVGMARHRPGEAPRRARLDPAQLPTDWTEEATGVLADYLRRLVQRDHTEGAAAWVVDAGGYQATLPAAYGRVLGEASLQVVLRAGLLAAEAGLPEIDAALARRGVAAYETSYHSLPTLGSIL